MIKHAVVKSILNDESPLLIVASNKINNLPATPPEIHPSFTGIDVSGMSTSPGSDVDGAYKGGLDGNAATILMKLPELDNQFL